MPKKLMDLNPVEDSLPIGKTTITEKPPDPETSISKNIRNDILSNLNNKDYINPFGFKFIKESIPENNYTVKDNEYSLDISNIQLETNINNIKIINLEHIPTIKCNRADVDKFFNNQQFFNHDETHPKTPTRSSSV
jgi:hypothetical protein